MHRALPAVLLALAAPAGAQTLLDSWYGSSTDENFGRSVAFAGDVDADGHDDIIVGAPFANPLGLVDAGRATIFSGADGSLLHTLNGAQAYERHGWSVAGVGDVNDDGHADVAVGAMWFDGGASLQQMGALRVYSGQTGAQIYQRTGPKEDAWLGYSVDGVGDWNLDGTPDIVVGAPGYDALVFPLPIDQVGYAEVVSGKANLKLAGFTGAADHDSLGTSVAGAGDVDGFGVVDVALGSPGADTTASGGGKASVYRGETSALKFAISGTQTGGSLGQSVDGGDFNGDGLSDIVVGAYFQADKHGIVRVFHGPSGSAGQIHTGSGSGDFLGYSVACVGDADKDGCDDLAGGAYQSGDGDAGYARVWSGKTGTLLYSQIPGADAGDHFGVAVAGGGDLDADGWPDLLIGANLHDLPFFMPDAGAAYAYDILVHQEDIGFGGPGTAKLDVFGPPLSSGHQAELLLTGGPVTKPATLFASSALAPVFFKGGVLAPSLATAISVPLATDALGEIHLTNVKGGGGPFDVHVQILMKDPAQVKGYALSNAVKMHFLP